MAVQQRIRPSSGRGRPAGGSERKRAAISEAALQLFLRDGYARTSVDAIAEEAGVSKRTIYNHYGDKESLFLSVVSATYDSMISVVVALMDTFLTDVPDDARRREHHRLRLRGRDDGGAVAGTRGHHQADDGRGAAFRRAPGLQMRPRGITAAIAERLIRLDARGLLDVPEPEEAASHLFALTMGQMNNRSLFGAIPLTDDEIRHMATSGARAFLRAYRPG